MAKGKVVKAPVKPAKGEAKKAPAKMAVKAAKGTAKKGKCQLSVVSVNFKIADSTEPI